MKILEKNIYLAAVLICFVLSNMGFAQILSGDDNYRFPFFLDVSVDHKDFDAITYLHSQGMINGYSDNTFNADNAISRVESVKLLLDASKKTIQKSSKNTQIFSDIPSGKWFSNYVYTAKKIGVINFDGEAGTGNFNPTRTVNRAEAIKMILEINNVNVRSAYSNEQWFYPYFEKANDLHIFNKKYKNGELNELYSYAGDNLTRGEVSTYVYRYIVSKSGDLNVENSSDNTLSADLFSENYQHNPLRINALFEDGLLKLKWNANSSDIFNVKAIQYKKNGTRVMNSIQVVGGDVEFDTDFFKKNEIGLLMFVIEKSGKEVARFNLPVYTKFTPYINNEFAINKISTTYQYGFPNKKISAQIDIKNSGNSVDFSKYKAYVLNSTENLYEKSVTSYDDSSLYFEFIPKIRDLYIIEIVDEFGLAKAVIPVTPYGFFPILPNNLDILNDINKNNNSQVNLNSSDIIKKINTLRKNHNINFLIEKEELTSLAKIRARDMKERNYISHYTPEGLNVNDMRSDYSLTSSLSENIATHSRGSAFATIGLEYSPTHRKTLLNPNLQFVGVATELLDSGEVLLVEVFQDTVLVQADIDDGQILLYDYISNKFSTKNANITLQNATEDWSKIMAEKESAQTDFSDGSSWKNILDAYDITSSTGIFVLSHQSPVKMIEYFEKNPQILSDFFQKKISYGLSLKMDKLGIVYLTLLGSE